MKPSTVPRGVARPSGSLGGGACAAVVAGAFAPRCAHASGADSSTPATMHTTANRSPLLDITSAPRSSFQFWVAAVFYSRPPAFSRDLHKTTTDRGPTRYE